MTEIESASLLVGTFTGAYSSYPRIPQLQVLYRMVFDTDRRARTPKRPLDKSTMRSVGASCAILFALLFGTDNVFAQDLEKRLADARCLTIGLAGSSNQRARDEQIHERVTATVYFSGGTAESEEFPYDWTYPTADSDPFSVHSKYKGPIKIQRGRLLGPPGHNPLARYILAHADRRGFLAIPPSCRSESEETFASRLGNAGFDVQYRITKRDRVQTQASIDKAGKEPAELCLAFKNDGQVALSRVSAEVKFLAVNDEVLGNENVWYDRVLRPGQWSSSIAPAGAPYTLPGQVCISLERNARLSGRLDKLVRIIVTTTGYP